MNFIKVKDNPGLIKDMETNAILNVDKYAADEYIRQKNLINNNRKMQEELADLKDKMGELEVVKNDIGEIKNLLKELLSK